MKLAAWKVPGICALLALLVILVFGQTARQQFINYDDNWYVYANPEVTSGLTATGVLQAFTHKTEGLWTPSPLVTLSHMLDWQVYKSWAGGHHLTNVGLHLCSVILLFLILRQMTGALWRSAFVAALFAIHPLRVESVAWISERKDMLSGLFFLLALGAYLRYVQRPGSAGRYLAVIFLFAMALTCKPMVVTLPFVLLLLDYWPLGRLFRPPPPGSEPSGPPSINGLAFLEKLPLLALSLGLFAAVQLGRDPEVIVQGERIAFWARMCEAPVWIVTYLGQMLWPAGLAIVYTHYETSLRWAPAALLAIGLFSLLFFRLRKDHPYLWMGWLWNLVMLMPVDGFIQIARHGRADHYTYLPQIGLYIGLTWFAADWAGERRPRRAALGAIAGVALGALASAAWRQTTFWHDSVTLWTHALACTRDNYMAHANLGTALLQQGNTGGAIAECREALRINPSLAGGHNDLGIALFRQGQPEQGIAEFREAVRLFPGFAEAHCNLGNALFQRGQPKEGIAQFREAIGLNPAYERAHYSLGKALLSEGQMDEGIREVREALRLDPSDAQAQNTLARTVPGHGPTGNPSPAGQ
jgi:Flp pilus assembly protein TadD